MTISEEVNRVIDIVISHKQEGEISLVPIELKCFRLYTRNSNRKRVAQNLGMYDYWEDIENIEEYTNLRDFDKGFQLTLTDDTYYLQTEHKGEQEVTYSTYKCRDKINGFLENRIANRTGLININGSYSMNGWKQNR